MTEATEKSCRKAPRQHQTPPPGYIFMGDTIDATGRPVPGIATRLGISVSTYKKWRMAGKGPVTFQLGKRTVAPIDAVEQYLAAQADAAAHPSHDSRPAESRVRVGKADAPAPSF